MHSRISCFLCGLSAASQRLLLPSIGARWICDPCDPRRDRAASPERLLQRMTDALVLAGAAGDLDPGCYRRASEVLRVRRFDGGDVVAYVERAMNLAAARLAGGERPGAAPPPHRPRFEPLGVQFGRAE